MGFPKVKKPGRKKKRPLRDEYLTHLGDKETLDPHDFLDSIGIPDDPYQDLGIDPDYYYIPPDLNDMNLSEIRVRHAKMVSYLGMLSRAVACLDVKISYASSEISEKEAVLKKVFSTQDKWQFQLLCKGNSEWRLKNKMKIDLENKRLLIKEERSSLEKKAEVLSREQTARQYEIEHFK